MKQLLLFFAIPLFVTCTSCAQNNSWNIAYENGFWFDGEEFIETTFYSSDGIFVHNKPFRIDTTINLEVGFAIPPFGEAHSHHYETPALLEVVNELSLRDGVFYGMSMTNWVQTKDEVLPFYDQKHTIDVAFADMGLTASYGHPIMVYENLARGIFTFERKPEYFTDRRAEGRAYLLFDSVDEVEEKWPEVTKSNPDLLKIYLLNTENREQLISDTSREAHLGLEPKVAEALIRRAKKEGLRVAAHIETAYDFRLAVNIGVDIIAHMPGYGYRNNPDVDPGIYRITEADAKHAAEAGVIVIPTPLRGESTIFENEADKKKVWDFYAEQLLTLDRAGIVLAMGADGYMQTPLQEVLFIHELNIFSNRKLLKMWGENTAKTIFPKRNLGRLEPGYEADFLALECNPLEEISCIQKIMLRVKRGEVLDGLFSASD